MKAPFLYLLLTLMPQSPPPIQPLPELKPFLTEFQVKRPGLYKALGAWGVGDFKFRSQYTYRETCTKLSLDSNGKVKNQAANVYEVIPSSGPLALYRRQTVRDGVPLTEKELEKQDREFNERSEKEKERRAKAATKAKPEPAKDTAAAPPKPAPEPLFLALYDFQMVRREFIDGHPVILLNFKPKPGFKTNEDMGKLLQHAEGRAWVSEDDYELVRIEIETFEPISFGGGLLAKVQKGSKASMEWRKINDEIWLPYKRQFTADARVLLLKGMHESEVTEFSNHKKYVVNTELKFGAAVEEKP
jgi:hypothetical protein